MTGERPTVAQIATSSLAAARVLEEYGINYCTDPDLTLEEACAKNALDAAALQEQLSSISNEIPEDRDWTTASLLELMEFLSAEHVLIESELAVLMKRMATVVEAHANRHPGLRQIESVFKRLCDDLRHHTQYEEKEIFPAIARYVIASDAGTPLKGSPLLAFGGPLRMLDTEHESSGSALRLLHDFVQNYGTPGEECPMYRMLVAGIIAVEDRLLRHMYVETNVLFPRAAKVRSGRAGVQQP